ncbi:hypothetical protein MCANUF33_02755 [Mycoplasmopsis canis UF33]|nr:hypothetical protein MCANUF33_02755 [Mycoplasmopsis canis UF33]
MNSYIIFMSLFFGAFLIMSVLFILFMKKQLIYKFVFEKIHYIKNEYIKVNILFKESFESILKKVRRNHFIIMLFYLFLTLMLITYLLINFLVFKSELNDETDYIMLVWPIIPFFISAFHLQILFISKKRIKDASAKISKWSFDNESFYFDKEYAKNENLITGNLKLKIKKSLAINFNLLKNVKKKISLGEIYLIIWGVHFSDVKNVEYNNLDIYQDFVNLYYEENEMKNH